MSSLNPDEALDRLLNPTESVDQPVPKRSRSAEWQPGIEWRGDDGTVTTGPIAGTEPPEWKAVLSVFDLDPAQFEVVEPVLFNAWHGPSAEGPVLYRQWKAKVIRRQAKEHVDIESLIEEIRKHKPPKRAIATGDGAFVVVAADWQIGKSGTAETVQRVLQAIDDVEVRVKQLRKAGRSLGSLFVLWPGDSVEGCVGHYEMQTFTVELDRREQVKVTRRLLRDALIRWSKLFEKVVVVAVGGNHGENRQGGKAYTTFGDNDDLAVVEQVADILRANPEAYGHVEFVIPADHLTVTVECAGWILGVTHGHVARESGTAEQKLRRWFERQAGGRQPIGDADILVTGHYHHTRMADWGATMWLQAPALDSGSEWWRLIRGEHSAPGVLTFAVYPDRKVADLEIL